MRGGVSLALALAIPASVGGERSLVIFLAFVTIVLTLVAPGFTLAPLLRRVGLQQDALLERQEHEARYRVTHAGLERLDQLEDEGSAHEDVVARLRATYEARLDVAGPDAERGGGEPAGRARRPPGPARARGGTAAHARRAAP